MAGLQSFFQSPNHAYMSSALQTGVTRLLIFIRERLQDRCDYLTLVGALTNLT